MADPLIPLVGEEGYGGPWWYIQPVVYTTNHKIVKVGVLVRAEELRIDGEVELCFCETDSDLQPWDRLGDAKQPLTDLYDKATVWVYGDFDLRAPERLENWPE